MVKHSQIHSLTYILHVVYTSITYNIGVCCSNQQAVDKFISVVIRDNQLMPNHKKKFTCGHINPVKSPVAGDGIALARSYWWLLLMDRMYLSIRHKHPRNNAAVSCIQRSFFCSVGGVCRDSNWSQCWKSISVKMHSHKRDIYNIEDSGRLERI